MRTITRILALSVFMAIFFMGAHSARSEESGSVYQDWKVAPRLGRVFYTTPGTEVTSHELGFFKASRHCGEDTIWLSLGSLNEKVTGFQGQETVISLNVDGKEFRAKPVLLKVRAEGYNHVMMFTNWTPGEGLIDALIKGRTADVRILEPKELKAALEVNGEQFSLMGFTAARGEAVQACADILPTKVVKKAEPVELIQPAVKTAPVELPHAEKPAGKKLEDRLRHSPSSSSSFWVQW